MTDLSEKLNFLFKVFSLSRAGLAREIGVDKSLVGRWASGKVHPSDYNLARLSQFIGRHIPGFSVLDWERSFKDFTAFVTASLDPSPVGANTIFPLLTPKLANQALQAAKDKTSAYEGIWKSTRPSADLPGEFLHDLSMVRRTKDGFLYFTGFIEGLYYQGSAVLINRQLYYFAANDEIGTVTMGIINGVARSRAEILDGITITTLLDSNGSPAAMGLYLERIGDLTGNEETDKEQFRVLAEAQNMLAAPNSVPPNVSKALHRTGNAPGMLLLVQSLARGPLLTADR